MSEVPYIESSPQIRSFNLTRNTSIEKWSVHTVVQFDQSQSKRQRNVDVNFTMATEDDISLVLLPASYMDKINEQGLAVALTSEDECLRNFAAFIQSIKRKTEQLEDDPPF